MFLAHGAINENSRRNHNNLDYHQTGLIKADQALSMSVASRWLAGSPQRVNFTLHNSLNIVSAI